MNGFQTSASVRMGLLLAGILLLGPSPIRSDDPVAAKKTAPATRKILGRALDADGKPCSPPVPQDDAFAP